MNKLILVTFGVIACLAVYTQAQAEMFGLMAMLQSMMNPQAGQGGAMGPMGPMGQICQMLFPMMMVGGGEGMGFMGNSHMRRLCMMQMFMGGNMMSNPMGLAMGAAAR